MIENLQHLISVSDLFLSITKYLTSINVENKPAGYTPKGTLVNGALLNSGTVEVTIPSDKAVRHKSESYNSFEETRVTKDITVKLTTSESISSNLTAVTSNTTILKHFSSFKEDYLDSIVNDKKYISVTHALLVVFITMYFIEKRFIYVYDKLGKSKVLLYNTSSSVSYNVPSITAYTKIDDSLLNFLLSKINNMVLTRSNTIQLNAISKAYTSSGVASSSSSSCSSSCSSSSCSSSCSCSSSSGFIIYFI